jgi:hypothetical protein
VLWEIIRWLEWENPVCRYNATQISKLLKISPGPMGRFLKILESPEIGAIVRKRVGRVMVILVNPEGAWRGYLDNHPKALAHFRAQVESMPSYRRRSSRDLGTANPTPTGG